MTQEPDLLAAGPATKAAAAERLGISVAELDRMSDADLDRAARDHAAAPAARRFEAFGGLDHTGMPAGEELARAERASLLSFLPGRCPWEDVTAYEAQLAENTASLAQTTERLRVLREQLANEPARHTDALSEWMLSKRGKRPESRAAQLAGDLADAEAERDALRLAGHKILEDRAAHVEKHRKRLVKDADRQVEQRQRRMLELIDELERQRAMLASTREWALWARVFPGQAAGRMPQWRVFAGALKRFLEPIGLKAITDADKVYAALRGDVEWLAHAVGDEQRVVIEGERKPDDRRDAVWSAGDTERTGKRAALEAARRAFIADWGFPPTEVQLEDFVRERGLGW